MGHCCSAGGENGFNQAIELSADTLANVKFVQEKRLISKFFDEISQVRLLTWQPMVFVLHAAYAPFAVSRCGGQLCRLLAHPVARVWLSWGVAPASCCLLL